MTPLQPLLALLLTAGAVAAQAPVVVAPGSADRALPIEGTILNETVFLHTPSGTLICSDLIENFKTSDHWLTRVYLKASGVYGKPGLSRALRIAFRDKRAARQSIDAILERPFEGICLAHGDPILRGGREALRESYRWLRP